MKQKKRGEIIAPKVAQLEQELKRVRYKTEFSRILLSTIYTLIVACACAVLIATLWLPVLRIYGTSMNPTLRDKDIVMAVKTSDFKTGDLVAFYLENKILIKRCIAKSGDWVDIDEAGNVYVNNIMIEEPYLEEKAFGECNIKLPYQVPDNSYFLMGDHRSVSIDSRNKAVGCVDDSHVVGKIIIRCWPLESFGFMNIRKAGRNGI